MAKYCAVLCQAIVSLMQCGKVRYVVSQNVDGLHLRSGVPREKIAELHGNCFAERCPRCKKEYIRDFEIETVRDHGSTGGQPYIMRSLCCCGPQQLHTLC